MKNTIVLLLCLALLCSLAGCGAKKEENMEAPTNTVTPALEADISEILKPIGGAGDVTAFEEKVIRAKDLMSGTSGTGITEQELTDEQVASIDAYAMRMFSQVFAEENCMISPISILYALAMTENGTANETLEQMRAIFCPELTLEELNACLYTYAKQMQAQQEEGSKFEMANSIWISDCEDFRVQKAFLQTNADYYQSAVYQCAMDDNTLSDMNNWVYNKTDGMIPKALDRLDKDTLMVLMNAVLFEGAWEQEYSEAVEGEFACEDGTTVTKSMLSGIETTYLSDDDTEGFLKQYNDGRFAFVALLPAEGIKLADYVASLDGEKWKHLMDTKTQQYEVVTKLPKFEEEYSANLADILCSMGMTQAFDKDYADFSNLGTLEHGNIYVDSVLHKTYIDLDEKGTKAAAVTIVSMVRATCMEDPKEQKEVLCDRPFVYAIVDMEYELPIFLGTLME